MNADTVFWRPEYRDETIQSFVGCDNGTFIFRGFPADVGMTSSHRTPGMRDGFTVHGNAAVMVSSPVRYVCVSVRAMA